MVAEIFKHALKVKGEISMNAIKVALLAGLIVISTLARGANEDRAPEAWNIGGETHSIYWNAKLRAEISASCRAANCGAKTLLKKAKIMPYEGPEPTFPDGGFARGRWYCTKLGGTTVSGKDSRNNQDYFCRASDKTFIDIGTLGSD